MALHQWFESDPDRAPDSDFEPGTASHLCVGNEGRLLDFRRTPVRVKDVWYETGLAGVEILAFEDRGAVWDVPFEEVEKYQFRKGCPRAPAHELEKIRIAVRRFDRREVILADARNREAALRELARERELGDSWLSRNSRFLQSGRSLPEGQPEGDALLYQDIRRYMDERGLLDLESTFARTYVSNMNNEYVKVHRVAVARSGLASYRGKVIRDSSLTAGPLAFERRKKHVLARMGWVQALLRRCGRESIVLYRMESCDGPLQPRRRETALVSASFRMDIVKEMSGWADSQRTVVLYRQAVPVERVFMTYLETEAMNRPFREAEAVLLADPSNQAF